MQRLGHLLGQVDKYMNRIVAKTLLVSPKNCFNLLRAIALKCCFNALFNTRSFRKEWSLQDVEDVPDINHVKTLLIIESVAQ